MTLTVNHPTLREQTVNGHSASIGASPIVANTVAPFRGFVVNLFAVTNGTITTANATISTAVNGTAITNGNFTVNATGAAAGQYFEVGYGGIRVAVNQGDIVSFTPSGASGANVPANFGATIVAG